MSYTTDDVVQAYRDSVKRKYLTESLLSKIERMVCVSGADPIIRAQDYDAGIPFTIKNLEGNWYQISYIVAYNGKCIDIPVRVKKEGDAYKIDYITPPWNLTMYGDSLLIDNSVRMVVDSSAPLLLLETFYSAYTMEYCNMLENLDNRLQHLRETFCTKRGLKQFDKAVKEQKDNGYPGYDLLIGNFDFDSLWLFTVVCRHVLGTEYEFSYKANELIATVRLDIVKQGDGYRIDGVKLNL